MISEFKIVIKMRKMNLSPFKLMPIVFSFMLIEALQNVFKTFYILQILKGAIDLHNNHSSLPFQNLILFHDISVYTKLYVLLVQDSVKMVVFKK